MIAQLTGTVTSARLLTIIVDVQGIGYLVAVRNPGNFTVGASVVLYTYLAVRENALDLYGFLRDDEREMFELLLTLPKIGPKSAMQILTQADVPLLTSAIMKNDPVYLSKMSGISKKTAEKIVLELKDKAVALAAKDWNGTDPSDTDIVDALIALGYSQKDARDALQKLSPDIPDTTTRIKEALRLMGKP